MERLYRLFNEDGIDEGWLYSLTYGETYYFNNDTELLSYYVYNDELNINAKSVGDKKFSTQLLREILKLVKSYDKVSLPTTVQFSDNIMKRYNVTQIDNVYYKGGTYE